MQLTTLKERIEGGDVIAIYELMSNLEEADRKYLIMKIKREAKHKRNGKTKFVWTIQNSTAFPKEV